MFIICDNGVNREMTAEEIAEQESFIQKVDLAQQAKQSEEIAKAQAKGQLLERLGMTAEEASLLLS